MRTLCFLLPTFYFLLCASAPGQAYPLTPGGLATTDIDTIAELNALVSDADVAILGANTFSGHQLYSADNTYDIGASGATRPRTIYVGTNVTAGGAIQSASGTSTFSSIQIANGSGNLNISSTTLNVGSSGSKVLFVGMDTGLLQFGGTTSSFPAIKRNATALNFRLADDSDHAPITAGSVTIGGGAAITKVVSATGTLDFGSTAAGTSTDLTITVTGAALGNVVSLGVPNGSAVANSTFSQWVSATNTVTVRFVNNALVTAADPASGTFRVQVNQF